MDLCYSSQPINIDEYLAFLDHAGWHVITKEAAEVGLSNSVETYRAESDGKLVGIARVNGDSAIYCYLQDMIVHPDYQGLGVGGGLLTFLLQHYRKKHSGMLFLMSAGGKAGFYEKYGFVRRPDDSPGMMLSR